MDYEKKNLQNEPDSMQRQTQKDQHGNADGQQEEKERKPETFGIIPVQQAESSDADFSVKDKEDIELRDIDDEKIILGIKAKRNPWNSITFDKDDFLGEMMPI